MNTPKIRFKGFEDDWEQRKLGDMGSTFTGLSGKTKEDFGHGDAKFITYMNVFSNPMADLYMTESVEVDAKQNCVKAGDVFFTTSSETPEEVGMSSVMPVNADNIYLNSFCFGYRPIEKFDLNYLAYVLRADSFRKEMTFLAQGISRYNISKNKVMEVAIPVPTLEEQSKVGEYFSNLDRLITLHQRKCDETKQLKKFMLQKMFPKNGEKNPEIRFEGFTDDWEQRKVGEVTKELLDYDNFSSGLPLLTSSRSGLMYQSEYRGNATTENENTLFSVVPLNACTYRHMSDDSTFHLNINTLEKGLVSKEYPVFQENESNLKFIVQYINSSNSFTKFCTEQKKGGTRTRLYYKTLCEYKLMMPSIKEQNKTANFFDTLDHLITLHQRKCEKLKELKKFMLQNMFV